MTIQINPDQATPTIRTLRAPPRITSLPASISATQKVHRVAQFHELALNPALITALITASRGFSPPSGDPYTSLSRVPSDGE